MKHRYTLGVIAAIALAGCGSQVAPTGGATTGAASASHGKSWMLSEAKQIRKLLYISDGLHSVYVYNYETQEEVGTLGGFESSSGQCVDAKGDVWITDFGADEVVEFAHGDSTPISVLQIEKQPVGCSVAPDGNLAVASEYYGIQVWKNASGSPMTYRNAKCDYNGSPGYDDHGNLYFESSYYYYQSYSKLIVCELPAKAEKLRVVKVYDAPGGRLYALGGVMWDGKYITLASLSAVDQATEKRSGDITVVGTTQLNDPRCGGSPGIYNVFIVGERNTPVNRTQGTEVLASDTNCEYQFDAWKYPGGVTQVWSISGVAWPAGESVSLIK